MLSLLDIKRYLMQVQMASLNGLCAYFKADVTLMRQMLSHWIHKGCVKRCVKKSACGTTCMKCDLATVDIYEWVHK